MAASRILSDLRSIAKIAVLLLLVAAFSSVLLTGCKLIEDETESAKGETSVSAEEAATDSASEPTTDGTEPVSGSETTPEESSEPEESTSKPIRLPMDEF